MEEKELLNTDISAVAEPTEEDISFEKACEEVLRTYSPILRPSSTCDTKRISNDLSDDLATAFSTLTKPASPSKFGDTDGIKMGSGKAHYYSQLSVMLFERAVEENPAFPEDLDRIHSWFTKELSDAQKLVCLHELLSLMSPSQHRFLFTSVAFDTQPSGEDETVWLDLAMSESQKQVKRVSKNEVTTNKLEDRLKSLDLKPGESLFSGLKISKSKLPTEKREDSQETFSQSQCFSPVSTSDTSKFSAILNKPKIIKTTVVVFDGPTTGNAPPGFLSPTAAEYRPSEPCCHSETFMSDFSRWLRLLRLHKYDACLTPVYDKDKVQFLRIDENGLEAAGVAAMGARKKFLRLFERIRNELKIN